MSIERTVVRFHLRRFEFGQFCSPQFACLSEETLWKNPVMDSLTLEKDTLK